MDPLPSAEKVPYTQPVNVPVRTACETYTDFEHLHLAGEVAGRALHFTTNKNEHRQRRKVWDRAFNAKALREYEPRLNRHALALISKLKEQATWPSVRITNWVNFYSFDVMGDIGFNRSFGMVESGEEANVIKLLHDSQAPLSVLVHTSWAMRLIARTPIGSQPLFEHIDWSAKVLEERKKVKAHRMKFLLRFDLLTAGRSLPKRKMSSPVCWIRITTR
jgi:cytochrome P450